MFEGFTEERIEADGIQLFVRHRIKAELPPMLMLHGYPQTSAMWRRVAPLLQDHFSLIIPDLRGYGRSDKPASSPDHSPYSKRQSASDLVALMHRLGFDRFAVIAHDRGARVAHRLGMDHPGNVTRMSLLDIAPTQEMYAATDMKFATAYWHWFFLIQLWPLPEEIIAANPDAFWKHKCINPTWDQHPFGTTALEEYLKYHRDPAAIHAMCEDYRAAASIDLEHDAADQDQKLNMPIQALWGLENIIETQFDALSQWRKRATDVQGQGIQGSHYVAEEAPETMARLYLNFFQAKLL